MISDDICTQESYPALNIVNLEETSECTTHILHVYVHAASPTKADQNRKPLLGILTNINRLKQT